MPSSFPFHGIFSSLGSSEEETTPLEQSFSDPSPLAGMGSSSATGAQGQVAVDIYEQDNYYIIKAPIAGVRLSDLDIEISDNAVTIRGVRAQSTPVPADQYYLQECFWGPFSRRVTLPCSIDPKKVKATFDKECVLKILIPKEEKVKIVRISEG